MDLVAEPSTNRWDASASPRVTEIVDGGRTRAQQVRRTPYSADTRRFGRDSTICPWSRARIGDKHLFGRHDIEQLDIEDQHSVRNARSRRRSAVSELAGNPEPRLVADHHQPHAFRPALDDAVKRKFRRLAAHDRAVKQLAVGGPSRIVN